MRSGKSHRIVLHFDGLCEPKNPGGIATYGFVAQYEDGAVICEGKGVAAVGMWGERATNNVAEYIALIKALECLLERGLAGSEVLVRGDSQLVIRQLKGEYKVRSPNIKPLYEKAKELLKNFKATLEWVPRDLNKRADALSREAFREFVEEHREEYGRFYSSSRTSGKRI